MKFLIDTGSKRLKELDCDIVAGQLLTPRSASKIVDGRPFAIDNGAFSGFQEAAF